MFYKYFIFILLLVFLKFIAGEEKQDQNGYKLLTDLKNTHHAIHYTNMDQCMRRPDQQNIGSYGLIFKRPYGFLCDELLICYPSQLLAVNVRNGLIPSIPFRLSRSKQNNITKQCKQKQDEFCINKINKYLLCSIGKSASTTWHGIKIKTEYFENEQNNVKSNEGSFITTISLSITDKEYKLNDMVTFNIEFGQKEDIYTNIYQTNIFKSKYIKEKELYFEYDYHLRNEYLSNVEKGAYLYKYAGLWALGLDLLPTRAQQTLDLFVYRGCACPMNAWFKNPSTHDTLLPITANNKKSESEEIKMIKDKDCPIRYTNYNLETLGNIIDKEKMVKFTLMAGFELNKVMESKVVLLDSDKTEILKIGFYADSIYFISNSKISEPKSKRLFIDPLITGAKIDFIIRLTKYYVWISIYIEDYNKPFVFKYWPENWWEGSFMNNSEVYLNISGNFIRVTPFHMFTLDENDVKNLANVFDHKIVMPYSFAFRELSFEAIVFKFSFMINENASKFYIKFLYGVREENEYIGTTLFGLNVNLNENQVITYSKNFNEIQKKSSTNNTLFKKGKPFYLEIIIVDEYYSSYIYVSVNNISQSDYSFPTNMPAWMFNRISIGDDIQLMYYKYFIESKRLGFTNKKEITKLKSNGTILCFEAKIPSAKEINYEKINAGYGENFGIFLLHNASKFDEEIGDIVLNLEFIFYFKKYTFGANITNILINQRKSKLILTSRKDKIWGEEMNFDNPVQTGMEIIVLIYAEKDYYNISINGGDYIHFTHRIPPWAVNHVSVEGFIRNVDFKSKRCERLEENLPKFQLPSNVLSVRPLTENEMIIIVGKIKEYPIIIYLLNGALKRHEEYGNLVLNLNITKDLLLMNSLARREWLLQTNDQIQHNLSLNEGQNIKIIFYHSPKKINFEIETKEGIFEGSYNALIPYIAIHYVEVYGLDIIEMEKI